MNAAVVGRARETTTSEMRRREEVRVENEDDWTIEDWPLISPPLQLSVKIWIIRLKEENDDHLVHRSHSVPSTTQIIKYERNVMIE
ncbi:hypothetical protein PRIPAC_95519 [Pristionchus pacificus]|uniref:Uncharacterized protein n=1 Tax=Pristionchus pacificus TaxID=54126 RepID=A0A2A6D174_PRIPA|nr:hypothetical protein PRIPAC_95519 [Pristionchus pacificus]|eukprot:PDM84033.1 hypothetical protein PRIPAC_34225 [Pristionchus pacificus]